ncbi:MAG: hypothetical protein ACE5IY_07885 [bacterium]
MKKPNYDSVAWFPILAVGLSMVAFTMIKTGRDAVFFQQDGLRKLPLAYIWIAIAAVPAAIIHLRAFDRWGARKTRTALFYLTAAVFLLFVPVTAPEHRFSMIFLFIIVPTLFAAVFAGAWLLAGDLLEGARQKELGKVYSRIGAASMMGGILGGLLSKWLSLALEPRYLLAGGAFFLVLVGLLVTKAHRDYPAENYAGFEAEIERKAESFGAKKSQLLKQRYVQILVGISTMATIAALYIDFQFYATATFTGNNNAQFFANFYIILNLASLAVQLIVAPRLQSKLGVAGALLLLPYALLGGVGIFSAWTIVQARTIMKVTEGGLKSSIHRSMWEQVYLPIDRKLRDVAKTVVDGMVARVAEGIGSLFLFVWLALESRPLEALDFNWISWVIFALIVGWIALTRYLGRLGCSDIEPVEGFIRLPDG